MPRRPTLIRAPALIYFAHPLDPALIQGNTISTKFPHTCKNMEHNFAGCRKLIFGMWSLLAMAPLGSDFRLKCRLIMELIRYHYSSKIDEFCDFSIDVDFSSKADSFRDVTHLIINQCEPRRPLAVTKCPPAPQRKQAECASKQMNINRVLIVRIYIHCLNKSIRTPHNSPYK